MNTVPEIRVGQRVTYQDAAGADHDALAMTSPNAYGGRITLVYVAFHALGAAAAETILNVPHYSGRLVTSDENKQETRRGRRGRDPRVVEWTEPVTRRQAGAFWRV